MTGRTLLFATGDESMTLRPAGSASAIVANRYPVAQFDWSFTDEVKWIISIEGVIGDPTALSVTPKLQFAVPHINGQKFTRPRWVDWSTDMYATHTVEGVPFSAVSDVTTLPRIAKVNAVNGSTTVNGQGTIFTSADVGKSIVIPGAGPSGADLTTTIASRVSNTQITVANAPSTTITGTLAKVGTGSPVAVVRTARSFGSRMSIDISPSFTDGTDPRLLWTLAAETK